MRNVVTIGDCRAAGYCVIGVRRHCPEVGLNFRELMGTGIPLEDAEKIDDAAVQRIVTKTKERLGLDG